MDERKPKNCTHIIWQEEGKHILCSTCHKILTPEEIQKDCEGRIDTKGDKPWRPKK